MPDYVEGQPRTLLVVQSDLNLVHALLSIDNLGQRQLKLLAAPEPEGQVFFCNEDIVNEPGHRVHFTSCDDFYPYWVGRGAMAVNVVVVEHNVERVSANSRVTSKSVVSN